MAGKLSLIKEQQQQLQQQQQRPIYRATFRSAQIAGEITHRVSSSEEQELLNFDSKIRLELSIGRLHAPIIWSNMLCALSNLPARAAAPMMAV